MTPIGEAYVRKPSDDTIHPLDITIDPVLSSEDSRGGLSACSQRSQCRGIWTLTLKIKKSDPCNPVTYGDLPAGLQSSASDTCLLQDGVAPRTVRSYPWSTDLEYCFFRSNSDPVVTESYSHIRSRVTSHIDVKPMSSAHAIMHAFEWLRAFTAAMNMSH